MEQFVISGTIVLYYAHFEHKYKYFYILITRV